MTPRLHPMRVDLHRLAVISLAAVISAIALLALFAYLGRPLFRPVATEVEIPAVSLAEAQQQVSFTIPQPAWLPEGLILKGAHVNPPNWAQTFYGGAEGGEAGLGIETTQGPRQGNYAYPDSAKQPVVVNGQPAVCVHGAWTKQQTWDSAADSGALEWSANDFSYQIGYSGLGLSCDGLIKIAESLQ